MSDDDDPPDCERCGRPYRIQTATGVWLCLPCDVSRDQAIERYERTAAILKLRERIFSAGLHGS